MSTSSNDSCRSDEQQKKDYLEKLIKVKLIKYTRTRKLVCKNGLFLEILSSDQISASKAESPFSTMQVISIGTNMVALWGRATQTYLAANEEGNILASDVEGRDCVFFERFTKLFFNVYESYHTYNKTIKKYLTLLPNGKVTTSEQLTDNSYFYWEVLTSGDYDDNNDIVEYVNI